MSLTLININLCEYDIQEMFPFAFTNNSQTIEIDNVIKTRIKIFKRRKIKVL